MMKNAPVVRTANRPTTAAMAAPTSTAATKGEVRVAAGQHREPAERIGPDAEQAGMAEGNQPAGRQQIEAQRKDRQDCRFGDQLMGRRSSQAPARQAQSPTMTRPIDRRTKVRLAIISSTPKSAAPA